MTPNNLRRIFVFVAIISLSFRLGAQGNKVVFSFVTPKNLSICGTTDTAQFKVFNVSPGSLTSIKVTLTLPPGVLYKTGSIVGTGLSENNITNLNKPVFNGPNIGLAGNFVFRVHLTADCDLLTFLNKSNIPDLKIRVDYSGNYDLGTSLPFIVKVPSIQFSTITNQTFTGNIGTKFQRVITIGNFGKGPLSALKLTRYNGKDIKNYFVKGGSTTFKTDTVITILGAADFKKIGNLDTFFDQNETITITDSNEIKGCKSLNTNYELSWGCGGKECTIVKSSGSAQISNQVPNLVFFPKSPTVTCYNDGNPIPMELKFTNNGQLEAKNTHITLETEYYFTYFDTAYLKIRKGWKGIPQYVKYDSVKKTSYGTGFYSCVGANSIAKIYINVGNIAKGDTIYLTWRGMICQPLGCNAAHYINGWLYSGRYYDQCNNVKTQPQAWGRYPNLHQSGVSPFTPTDLVNGQSGIFRYTISGTSLLALDASAKMKMDLVIPPGLVHSKNVSDFYLVDAGLTGFWYPDSLVMVKDTLRAWFPTTFKINVANADLVIKLTADCSIKNANGFQNVTLVWDYLPNAKCSPKQWLKLFCTTVRLKIHCTNSCNGGLFFKNFSAERTNFGSPDNNNDGLPDASGALDKTKIRKERVMVGDTITSVFQGKVLKSGSITVWRFGYAESTISYGDYLDVVSADVEIYRYGKKSTGSCAKLVRIKKIKSGVNATFKFDFSLDSIAFGTCISKSFLWATNDSIRLIVKYKLTKNLGGTSITSSFSNLFYLGSLPNPSAANRYQCDSFSAQVVLTGYYFTNCCAGTYNFNNCGRVDLQNNFYLGIGTCCTNYGGNNYFPYEYRNFGRLKAIRFYNPPGLRVLKSTMYQYRTSGSNVTTLEFKDTIKPVKTGTFPLEYETSKYYKDSSKGKINLSDDGFHGTFVASVEPSCELPSGVNIPIRYDFIFERKGSLGKGFDTIPSGGSSDVMIFNKPVITVKPTIPTIYASKDTAEWEIIYTNYSSTYSTANSWFYPDNSGRVKVVEIRDSKNDTLLKPQNGIFKAGQLAFNTTRKFKVRAIYNSCEKDSIVIYTGWNCVGYPSDFSSYPCTTERTPLYLEPQNTQFQLTLTDSADKGDLCTTTPYTILLENVGATTAYNNKIQITLPIGMEVVPGQSKYKYPLSGSFVSAGLPKLVSGTTYEWDLSALNSTIQKGFVGVNDVAKNKVLLSFRVSTSCDYSSGNFIRASASANIRCGDPVQVYPTVSNPYNIAGVIRPYYSLLKCIADSILPCEKPGKVKVKILILGPDTTGIEDKFQVVLPKGFTYDSTLYSSIHNGPVKNKPASRDINGSTELEWNLPHGIKPADSLEFTFGYSADNRYVNCGNSDIYCQSVVKQEVTCVSSKSKCKINVVTGNQLLKPWVDKGSPVFSKAVVVMDSFNNTHEFIKATVTIKNNGKNILKGTPTAISFFFDKNRSGTVDKADIKLYSDTFYNALKKDSIISITVPFKIPAGYSCAMFAAFDSATCACKFTQIKFGIPPIKNAGKDIFACDGSIMKVGLPSVKGFKYLWQSFGELNDDTLSSPIVTYLNSTGKKEKRTYVLTTNRGQCNSKDTVNVFIYPLPSLNLSTTDSTVCASQKVLLKGTSLGGSGLLKYRWSPSKYLSDSTKAITISKPNFSVKYTLKVSDSFGCEVSGDVNINAKPYPKAWFTYADACEGNPIIIKDSSTIAEDTLSLYHWYHQKWDTLNVKDWSLIIKNTFKTSVRLVVESPFGCGDTADRDVYLNPQPNAKFSITSNCFGDSTRITNSSSVSVGMLNSYAWNLGDGKTSNLKNPVHLYGAPGKYVLRLVVKSAKNCTDTITDSTQVYYNPVASFSHTNVCLGDTIHFNNKSTITNDTFNSYHWDFAQVGTSFNKNPWFIFAKDTTYNVTLDVTTSQGCVDTFRNTVELFTIPVAGFSASPVCEGQATDFKDLSRIAKGTIASKTWLTGDGNSFFGSSFVHKYSVGDTFSVRLKTISAKGCIDSISGIAVVYPKLIPDFAVSDHCFKDSARFTDKTTGLKTGVSKWNWYFGSGDSAAVANPVYKYSVWGTYVVKLTTTSNFGCIYDTTGRVNVMPLPVVDFTTTNTCFDNVVSFDGKISIPQGSIAALDWDFGDGSKASIEDLDHQFSVDGNHMVKLWARSAFGCVDSVTKTIVSYSPVTVAFISDSICLGYPITFFDQSIVPNATISKYDWKFGDGAVSTQSNPTHLYNSDGVYKVNYGITTSYNCRYDTFEYVWIYPKPTAGFTISPDQATIVNPEINFTDISTGADSLWYDLGDGNYSLIRNFAHQYPDSGTFNVMQYTSNKFGCRDSFAKNIVVRFMYTFFMPTSFSPNTDGKNEKYGPGGMGISDYSMKVFNRWGVLVYQTENGTPWDGTYMNGPAPEGVYAVVFAIKDYKGLKHFHSTSMTLFR